MLKLIIGQEGDVLTCNSFDIPEWLLLEQVDDCEELSIFLGREKWNTFSKVKDYLFFANKFPMRIFFVDN
jgi:hypothetical protein